MISLGKNVRDSADTLARVTVQQLYDDIRNPSDELASLLGRLRIIREMDAAQYRMMKTSLPYFVCAAFNPPHRKTDNFAYTEYFIIDIDHISDKGLLLDDVRSAIKSDPRTVLCYTSPSGDGLKVLLRLAERCYDASLYKTFYKLFLAKYSVQHGLQQVVDSKTCDVCRACFLSFDLNAYYNAEAEPVRLEDYIDAEANISLALDLKHEADQASKQAEAPKEKRDDVDPSKDVIARIKARLEHKDVVYLPKPPVFVPEILDRLMDKLRSFLQDYECEVIDVSNIQYGKKLKLHVAGRRAEINLFYGKRGFSVVQSPKTGTDREANEVAASVVQEFLRQRMW